jgi:hypothetical protein
MIICQGRQNKSEAAISQWIERDFLNALTSAAKRQKTAGARNAQLCGSDKFPVSEGVKPWRLLEAGIIPQRSFNLYS